MISTRCAACKYLRRRCPSDCIFAPFFPPTNPQRFACVHKIFGASNVGKMLKQLPVHQRSEATDSLHFEAQCRIQDPVYGCVGIITHLQQQILDTQHQLAKIQAEIAFNAQQTLLGIKSTQLEELEDSSRSFNNVFQQPMYLDHPSIDPCTQSAVGSSSFESRGIFRHNM